MGLSVATHRTHDFSRATHRKQVFNTLGRSDRVSRKKGEAHPVNVVKAVHEYDLGRILKKLGLYERLIGGELRCSVCGRPLTPENVGGLYREGGVVRLVCDDIRCLAEAASRVARYRRAGRD